MDFSKVEGKLYESLLARRDIYYSYIETALDIVKKFILKKNLILYGGMALDFSFQLKGSFLYDPSLNMIPDYDSYSPTPIDDAYELADILHKAGLPEVNAINALHITTMRVRIGSRAVADISYVPLNIYKHLPTLSVSGKDKFRFINPIFQRIDLHESLTEPFRDPPNEVILNRFAKDIKRFKLVEEKYPVQISTPSIELKEISFKHFDTDVLFVGYVSYALHYMQLTQLIKKYKIRDISNRMEDIFEIPIQIDKKGITISVPYISSIIDSISLYTDDFEMIVKEIGSKKKPKYHNTFLDRSRPRMVSVSDKINWEIFDNRRSIKTYVPLNINGVDVKVASVQLTLMYFLQRYFEYSNDIYLYFYKSTLMITYLVEDILSKMKDEERNKSMNELSTFICTNWFGQYNLGDAFSIQMQYLVANNNGKRLEGMRAKSYWPERHKEHPKNDISSMEPWHIDGLETKPFIPVGTGWYDNIKLHEKN